jgi:hypothetical protein
MTVAYYISENKSDMRGIKHGWYAIEDDGNLSDRRGSRAGSAAPADPLRLTCGNLRVLGKRELDREERAPCGMSVPSTAAR